MAEQPGGPVLVARPQPGADALAAELLAAGHAALACPALEIVPVAAPPLPAGRTYHATLVTSANAVRHCGSLLDDPAALGQVLAVGPATAAALQARGLTALAPDDPRSEGLLAHPALAEVDARHILLIRGRGGRACLGTALEARGALVDHREVYARRSAAGLRAGLAAALRGAPPRAVVASSAEVAEALAAVWPGGAAACAAPLWVPSARVAERARAAGFRQVVDIDGAGTAAVLQALGKTDS